MYGGVSSPFSPKRKRTNLGAVCANIFVPCVVFAWLYALLSFSFHYWRPRTAWLMVLFSLFGVAGIGIGAVVVRQRDEDPKWHIFAFVSTLVAVLLAAVCGDVNFNVNMRPYYDVQNLETYPSVDPIIARGQQMMDSGRVYFSEGSHLDMRMAMGFKNLDVYCVAPITNGAGHLSTYDFWAIGINCCSSVSADFRCGEYNNKHARSGLRLMRDSLRPYFRLAVQQAEAAYKIKAAHPLFFYWMQDPMAEMDEYRDDGFKYYLLGVFTHFAMNVFCVVLGILCFNRMI